MIQRPESSEYFEFYDTYVRRVPDRDVLSVLDQSLEETLALLSSVPVELEERRYEPGKWNVREVIGHIIDAERVFAYRALHFARRDPAPLPSMEEGDYARASNAGRRPLSELAIELAAVRRSSILLFQSFDEAMLNQRGTASGYEFGVRSIPYIVAGHEIHHRSVLVERYL
ncbi:MAG: DinB family protein [Gemmatimonadales bacterium]|jgi:hypothetical protein